MTNHFKSGFTLVEALVTLVIIAVISLLLMGLMRNMVPDENISLAKKALNITQKTVELLTHDVNIYIDGTFDSCPSGACTDTYFCEQFVDQLNIKGSVNCGAGDSNRLDTISNSSSSAGKDIDDECGEPENFAFKTSDGIKWYNFSGQFEEGKYQVICVKTSDDTNPLGIAIREDGRVVPGKRIADCLDTDSASNENSDCTNGLYP